MARSIVYDTNQTRPRVRGNAPLPEAAADQYADKLVKYVPAEVLAFYLPAFALFEADAGRWAVAILGALGTVLWTLVAAKRNKTPLPWFYPTLALLAYAAWAIGVSALGTDVLGFSKEVATLIVLVAILAIPAVDELLS